MIAAAAAAAAAAAVAAAAVAAVAVAVAAASIQQPATAAKPRLAAPAEHSSRRNYRVLASMVQVNPATLFASLSNLIVAPAIHGV